MTSLLVLSPLDGDFSVPVPEGLRTRVSDAIKTELVKWANIRYASVDRPEAVNEFKPSDFVVEFTADKIGFRIFPSDSLFDGVTFFHASNVCQDICNRIGSDVTNPSSKNQSKAAKTTLRRFGKNGECFKANTGADLVAGVNSILPPEKQITLGDGRGLR